MNKPSLVKWIVIGVISIFFLILYRQEISQLLNRTESVKFSHEGVTLKTPIGITDVTYRKSQSSGYSTLYPSGKFVNYINNEYKYAISYPRNSIWKDISYLGPEWLQKLEALPGFSKAIVAPGRDDFIAMVSVRVYRAGNLTIQEALIGFELGAGEGVTYYRPRIDQSTNSATLPGYDQIGDKIMVSRVILIDGWLYDLRAMISPNASSKIKEEMNIIVNSFHMLY